MASDIKVRTGEERAKLLDAVITRGDAIRRRRRRRRQALMALTAVVMVVGIASVAMRSDRNNATTVSVAAPSNDSDQWFLARDGMKGVNPQNFSADCHNSLNPVCGPFRWDPAPSPNQPMQLKATVNSTTVKLGKPVTLTVVATDPDQDDLAATATFGDSNGDSNNPQGGCVGGELPARQGPWNPNTGPSHAERTQQHTYSVPGVYTITVTAESGGCYPKMVPGQITTPGMTVEEAVGGWIAINASAATTVITVTVEP